jgi:hypothetical protein
VKLASCIEEIAALKQLFWEYGDLYKYYLHYWGFYDVYQNKYYFIYMAWVTLN